MFSLSPLSHDETHIAWRGASQLAGLKGTSQGLPLFEEQVRHIRFEGDKLFIESPPMPHPNMYGKTVRVIVVWQREA